MILLLRFTNINLLAILLGFVFLHIVLVGNIFCGINGFVLRLSCWSILDDVVCDAFVYVNASERSKDTHTFAEVDCVDLDELGNHRVEHISLGFNQLIHYLERFFRLEVKCCIGRIKLLLILLNFQV